MTSPKPSTVRFSTLLAVLGLFLTTTTLSAQLTKGDDLLVASAQFGLSPLLGNDLIAADRGGVAASIAGNSALAGFALDYRMSLSDNFMLGGLVSYVGEFGDDVRADNVLTLAPALRFLLLNRAKGTLYLDATGGVNISNNSNHAFFYGGSVGYLFQPIDGVYLGPEVSYITQDDVGTLGLQLALNFRLGPNGRPGEKVIPTFAPGSILIGVDPVRLTIQGDNTSVAGRFSAYAFTAPRLALGAVLSVDNSGSSFDSGFAGRVQSSFTTLGLEARVRGYWDEPRRLNLFSELGLGVQHNSFRTEFGNFGVESESSQFFSASAAVGGQWFLREYLALECGPVAQRLMSSEEGTTLYYLNLGMRWRLR